MPQLPNHLSALPDLSALPYVANELPQPNPVQMAGDAAEMRLAVYDLNRLQANFEQRREQSLHDLQGEVSRQRHEIARLTTRAERESRRRKHRTTWITPSFFCASCLCVSVCLLPSRFLHLLSEQNVEALVAGKLGESTVTGI